MVVWLTTISLSSVNFTDEDVYEELCHLNPHKSPGPDKIPAILLKNLAITLAAPLARIFRHLDNFLIVGFWLTSAQSIRVRAVVLIHKTIARFL